MARKGKLGAAKRRKRWNRLQERQERPAAPVEIRYVDPVELRREARQARAQGR